jgi:alpha-glucuronidase
MMIKPRVLSVLGKCSTLTYKPAQTQKLEDIGTFVRKLLLIFIRILYQKYLKKKVLLNLLLEIFIMGIQACPL